METLRRLRKGKGITMKELGEVAGVAESTISQYETGKRSPDFETLLRFGEFFNVTVDYLLTGEEQKEKAPDKPEAKEDVGEMLDEILQKLGTESSISFNGKPMSTEAKELLLASLESNIKLADKISAMRQKEAEGGKE